jgi:hypothetical protein
LKSGSLNLLELSGPVQALKGYKKAYIIYADERIILKKIKK